MKTIKLLLMVIGISITCEAYAQEVNSQSEDEQFEGVKIGSRNYSRFKKGFIAPSDASLGVFYDHETFRLSNNELFDKSLNGGRISGVIHIPLSRKGILSIETPISLRFNYFKDDKIDGLESMKIIDFGGQFGVLLSTAYCFSEKCYITIACGAAVDFIADEITLKTLSGNKIRLGNLEDNNKLTKNFDFPICFSASFRYKHLGIRVNYDIGTLNRYKKQYYEKTGTPENSTKKNNHLGVGIQYYF
ncbi:MAG: hypothetical protein J5942_08030 [Prevotella sp.]|nr:hypothetical protein [Prevotella sp.]